MADKLCWRIIIESRYRGDDEEPLAENVYYIVADSREEALLRVIEFDREIAEYEL